MAKGGSRSGGHAIPVAPSTAGQREAQPASTSDADAGPAHPASRKPSGGGSGHGNGANK